MAAAQKLLYQMSYEARFVAISHYYATVLKQKMTKRRMKDEKIELSSQQYLDVSNMSLLFPVGASFGYLFLKC